MGREAGAWGECNRVAAPQCSGVSKPGFKSRLTTYQPGALDKSWKRPHLRLPLCKMDTVKCYPPHWRGGGGASSNTVGTKHSS